MSQLILLKRKNQRIGVIKVLFIDSCYIIALMNVKAKKHDESLKLLEYIDNERTLINSTVILEIFNNLKKKRYEAKRLDIIDLIYSMDKIHYLDVLEYNNALDLCKYYNFSVNYGDCTIIQSMEKYNVNNIVSFDNDFDKVKGINRVYL